MAITAQEGFARGTESGKIGQATRKQKGGTIEIAGVVQREAIKQP
jgi:hypothetical protein